MFGNPSNTISEEPQSTSLTPCLVILVALVAALVAAFLGLTTWARYNRIPELTEQDLVQAEALWTARDLSDYKLEMKLGGDRPGNVAVTVVGGEVKTMTRDGRAPTQRRTWSVWTVEGQFDTLWRELQIAANPTREMNAPPGTRVILRAQFDENLGLPLRFHRAVVGRGPEVYWEITKFESPQIGP